MKRIISLSTSVVFGTVKEDIVAILPQLETAFRQREEFFEYYFDQTEIAITLEQLDRLSADYAINIDFDTITIEA
jgi:hypothetical protein